MVLCVNVTSVCSKFGQVSESLCHELTIGLRPIESLDYAAKKSSGRIRLRLNNVLKVLNLSIHFKFFVTHLIAGANESLRCLEHDFLDVRAKYEFY